MLINTYFSFKELLLDEAFQIEMFWTILFTSNQKLFNIFYNNGFITYEHTCDRRDGQLRAVIGD